MQYILKDRTRDDRYLSKVENDLIYNTPNPNTALRFNGAKFANALLEEHSLTNYIIIPVDEVK